MLAFFGDWQTGQESRKASQALHEQRCLQGRNSTHELRELQPLQTMFVFFFFFNFLCSTSLLSPSSSSVLSLSSTSQHDSASSAPLLLRQQALSLISSSVLFKDTTMASFSSATLFHDWFSVSNFLNKSRSSIVLLVPRAISSSFCLNKAVVFDSIFFSNVPTCCFLCSCSNNLNLSFCLKH